MKKGLLIFTCIVSLGTLAQAQDASQPFEIRPYAAVRLGGTYGFTDVKLSNKKESAKDFTFDGRLAFGAQFTNNFRGELEFSYISKLKDSFGTYTYIPLAITGTLKAEVESQFYLVNGYYDFNPIGGTKKFRPFVGAGIGLAYVESKMKIQSVSLSHDDTVFAIMGTFGGAYELNEKVSLDCAMRYAYADYEEGLHNLSIDLGIRYKF